jgi:hypothetical protein
MKAHIRRAALVLSAIVVVAGTGSVAAASVRGHDKARFDLVRSATAVGANCLKNAKAKVTIRSKGPVEVMKIEAHGLPRNTDFDLFIIQVPNAPFGLSWYQGDLQSDKKGKADGTFVGRFSVETFSVAPGVAPAPVVHTSPIPDASSNPQTAPVHQYHVGLWFNSPADASAAGCPATVTPFNGVHNAGVQALSTREFPDGQGPLRQVG